MSDNNVIPPWANFSAPATPTPPLAPLAQQQTPPAAPENGATAADHPVINTNPHATPTNPATAPQTAELPEGVCSTCNGHGAVGNILDTQDCPECTPTSTPATPAGQPSPANTAAFCAHFAQRISATINAKTQPVLQPDGSYMLEGSTIMFADGRINPLAEKFLTTFQPALHSEYKQSLAALYEVFPDFTEAVQPTELAAAPETNTVVNTGASEEDGLTALETVEPVNPHSQPSEVIAEGLAPAFDKMKAMQFRVKWATTIAGLLGLHGVETDAAGNCTCWHEGAGSMAVINSDGSLGPEIARIFQADFAEEYKVYATELGHALGGVVKSDVEEGLPDWSENVVSVGNLQFQAMPLEEAEALIEQGVPTRKRASSPAYKLDGATPVFNFDDSETLVAHTGFPTHVEVMARAIPDGWFVTMQAYTLDQPEYKGTGRKPIPTRIYEISGGFNIAANNAATALSEALTLYLQNSFQDAFGFVSYDFRIVSAAEVDGAQRIYGVWHKTPYMGRVFFDTTMKT